MTKQANEIKILISAFIGGNNLGDEAIFKSILENIDNDKRVITALSVNKEKTQAFNVDTLHARSIRDNINGIRDCDIILIGGGGIIQDQSSVLNFLYYAFQLYIAKRNRKPVILCFVGVGPIKHGLSKWLMKKLVAKNVDYAIVRDEKSEQELLKYGMDAKKVYQAHDPVINFPFEVNELKNLYTEEKPYVVVALRRWFFTNPALPVFLTRRLNKLKLFRKKYDRYMNRLANDLDEYLDKYPHIKLVLVSLYNGEDDIVNRDLLALMKNKDRVITTEKNLDEMQYLSIVRNSLFIIGMRLHSLILGSVLARPFVALRYSPKVDEFARKMNLDDLSMHVEEYNSEQLQEILSMATENHLRYETIVKNKASEYQKENQEAFSLLNKKIEVLAR